MKKSVYMQSHLEQMFNYGVRPVIYGLDDEHNNAPMLAKAGNEERIYS